VREELGDAGAEGPEDGGLQRHRLGGSRIAGSLNGAIYLIVLLEIALLPRHHMYVDMWDSLAGLRPILDTNRETLRLVGSL